MSLEPLYFVFKGDDLLIDGTEKRHNPLPTLAQLEKLEIKLDNAFFMGEIEERPAYVINTPVNLIVNNELIADSLRETYGRFDKALLKQAMRAKQISYWLKTNRYCGQCGQKNQLKNKEAAYHCNDCKLDFYPRISPCIIVLVTRGNEVLLGRSPYFRPEVYSLLAGFVEAGESIEEAVHREVFEEVGISINNLRYQHSQSWPFPHSLMMGFIAEYESGEIQVDHNELEDACWFHIDNLPKKPFILSIARNILDGYLQMKK